MESHEKFMKLALEQAEAALETGNFPVGCVMVEDGRVVSSGKRIHSKSTPNEIDHAEIIALRKLVAARIDNDLSRVVVYSTMEPCLMCFSTLIVSGIRSIVYGYEDVMGGGTNIDLGQLAPFYSSMKMLVIPHVLRDRSLLQFKKFFSDSSNQYLQGSLLANYTLKQATSSQKRSEE